MFEGKVPPSRPAPGGDPAGEGLRAVSWAELVARLDAARDLRATLRGLNAERDASFDPGSAQHIAALCDGKRGINLDDLVDGKAAAGIKGASHRGAAGDDPRK